MYITQQRANFSDKSSNDNDNANDNRGKTGKFGGDVSKSKKGKHGELDKNHARHDDQKEQISIDDFCDFCSERNH